MKRIATGVALLLLTTLLTGLAITLLWPADRPSQAAPAPPVGYLRVATEPPAATVTIDGQPWIAPPEIPAGSHTITLSAPGYEPVEYRLKVQPGQTVTLRGALLDTAPPDLAMEASPTLPAEGEVITVILELTDPGSGLAALDFAVDGEPLHTETMTGHPADRLELQIAALATGLHKIEARVTDAAGNSATAEIYVDVQPPAPTGPAVDLAALELPPPGQTVTAAESIPARPPSPAPTAPAAVQVVPTPISRAALYTETILIPTYGYTAALDHSGPRPRLDASRLTPPQPRPYRALILENDALRLVLLPELGGRLYQITDKATGEQLLYNNPVIKPTRWGPEDMNWWLAAGGIEWAYPVHEHGYAWAANWQYETAEGDEGVTVALRHTDEPTGLQAQVELFLPVQGRYFTLAPAVTNTGDSPAGAQLWLNAAFPAGPGQRLDFPAAQVKVHSAGEPEGLQPRQALAWQPELAGWGRWRTWFGAFAAPAGEGSLTVQGDGTTAALRRSFNPAEAPGLKFFTWGPDGPTGEWDGDPYFEVWGGLTADFDTYTNLRPGETRGWQEMWSVIDVEQD